jgi:hypothetical protein
MTSTYIKTGTTVRVYDSAVETFPSLPMGTYTVEFNPMSGFSLRHVEDLTVGEQIVYGGRETKVAKILRTWDTTTRSLGVMLSGDKGQGKSLFLRMLANAAIDHGLPVIRVTNNYPGLADFIDNLGECVVVFDEFEKIFPNGDEEEGQASSQTQFLSLFDGTSSTRRLYCVTVNKLHAVSDYLVNRPGRFHYHMRFDYPDAEDIRTYLRDQAPDISDKHVDSTVALAKHVPLNYDHLRVIAFEASTDPSASFTELVGDLNIKSVEAPSYLITATYPNGTFITDRRQINLLAEDGYGNLYMSQAGRTLYASFRTCDVKDGHDGVLRIPGAALVINGEDDEEYEDANDRPVDVTFELIGQRSYSYNAF